MTPTEDARFYSARVPAPSDDWRSAAERDVDRILSTSAFRRLSSVTQVVAVSETELFHNRLSHSLKVAQLAYHFAEKLRRNSEDSTSATARINPRVVYAAGLAHDLGHPPFGHIGEDELQRCLAGEPTPGGGEDPALALNDAVPDLDGFEGNAQTFRIVTKLTVRHYNDTGLNLTRTTLNAILKYPWLRGHHPPQPPSLAKKWGAYASEEAHFRFARENSEGKTPSLEAQLMDWADDVAYAMHDDVEDFYRAGLIPLDRLRNSSRELTSFMSWAAPRLRKKGLDPQLLKSTEVAGYSNWA